MSTNDAIRELMSAYVDAELTAEQAREVEQAAASDAALADELRRMRALADMVRRLPRESAPAGLAARVLAQAAPARLVARPAWRRWSPVAAAAAVLLGAGVFLAIHALRRQPPTGPAAAAPPSRLDPQTYSDSCSAAELAAARNAAAQPAAPEAGDALNVLIPTRDLAQAKTEVVRVLADNGVSFEAPGERMTKVGKVAAAEPSNRILLQDRQIRIEAVVNDEAAPRIIDGLNGVRARHQASAASGPARAPADATAKYDATKFYARPAPAERVRDLPPQVAQAMRRPAATQASNSFAATQPAPAAQAQAAQQQRAAQAGQRQLVVILQEPAP